MKITGITCKVVNAEMRNWVFVRVDTDQPGLYGWGEATLEWKTRAVAGAIADLAQRREEIARDRLELRTLRGVVEQHGARQRPRLRGEHVRIERRVRAARLAGTLHAITTISATTAATEVRTNGSIAPIS